MTARPDQGQPGLLLGGQGDDGLGSAVTLQFEDVYERHFDLVWRTLRRLGVATGSLDDALQDVFLVVYRRLPAFEQRSSLRTWLFGITLRVAGDYLRRGRRQHHTQSVDPELRDEVSRDPLAQAEHHEALTLLYAALAELDTEKRVAFVLAELEEMTVAQVSEAIGVNVNTVSSRVKAGRRQFEAALRRLRAKSAWRSGP